MLGVINKINRIYQYNVTKKKKQIDRLYLSKSYVICGNYFKWKLCYFLRIIFLRDLIKLTKQEKSLPVKTKIYFYKLNLKIKNYVYI